MLDEQLTIGSYLYYRFVVVGVVMVLICGVGLCLYAADAIKKRLRMREAMKEFNACPHCGFRIEGEHLSDCPRQGDAK